MFDIISALVPPICVALLFWFVIRSIVRADRSERASLARIEREARLERDAADLRGPEQPGVGNG